MMGPLRVSNLCKEYSIPRNEVDRLVQFASLGRINRCRKFVALDDVSFEVAAGGSVGIIGENGAGKSTLLKIITGVTAATRGAVEMEGRVSALLELGTGFHPELTGAQNVANYLKFFEDGRQPSEDLLERVRDFAELGTFYDRPMKTYSSGMRVRLGFAAACFVRPDLLIVDEALSVGDAYFQQKCLDKIEQFKKRGVSLLFVSHALPVVQMFCEKALYLEAGRVVAYGPSKDVIAVYEQRTAQRRGMVSDDAESDRAVTVRAPGEGAGGSIKQEAKVPSPDTTGSDPAAQTTPDGVTVGSRYGNEKIRITAVRFTDGDGRERGRFGPQDTIRVEMEVESEGDYPEAVFAVAVFRLDGVYIFSTNNYDVDPAPISVVKGRNRVWVEIGPLGLHRGAFMLTLQAYTEPGPPFWSDPADYHHKKYEIHVLSDEFPHGCVRLPAKWGDLGGRET